MRPDTATAQAIKPGSHAERIFDHPPHNGTTAQHENQVKGPTPRLPQPSSFTANAATR